MRASRGRGLEATEEAEAAVESTLGLLGAVVATAVDDDDDGPAAVVVAGG